MKHLLTDKNGAEFFLRRAEHGDLPEMTRIYNMAIRSRRCTGHMEEFTVFQREEWFREHSSEKYPIYVAEKNGKVIGYIHISPYIERQAFKGDIEITYYLDFDHRGIGIGSKMMDFMLKRSKELGYEYVIGTLLSLNAGSIGLLEKFGFKLWGNLPGIMNMGDGVICDFLIYGLKL